MAEKGPNALKEFTVQGARNLSLLRFSDPVTDSVSRKKEVQRKREPLGLKLKCDFGQKLQQAGVGVRVHLLGSLSPAARSSCLQVSVCVCVWGGGGRGVGFPFTGLGVSQRERKVLCEGEGQTESLSSSLASGHRVSASVCYYNPVFSERSSSITSHQLMP